MAERRMFAKTIIDSDAFLDMPASAQALYFHLAMRADDDGFINNPKKVMRIVGASNDDAKILLSKRFLLEFESGIIVIKHWWMHNYIQKDRYKPTVYQEERAQLAKKPNGAYTFGEEEKLLDTNCIQTVSKTDTQVRIGKDSKELGKDREDARTRDPFLTFAKQENDNDLMEAFLAWISEMAGSGKPITPKDQEAVLNKLRTEFPREEWIPAIKRSATKQWRTVYRRKEDGEVAKLAKRKKAWSDPVREDETERILRKTKEMEN